MTNPDGGRTRLRRRAIATGMGAGALLAATGGAARGQGVLQDELRFINLELFYGLDPVHEYTAGYQRLVGAAEALTRVTPGGEVEPELARAVEMLDPSSWRVHLRPEATFWSGQPVTPQAVVDSLERSRALAPPAATLLRGVRVEPAGDWAVRFASDAPLPGLPLTLAESWLVIHNAAAYGPQDNSYDLGAADLTGFFRIRSFEPRVRAVLERNERYWGVRPRMARVRYDEVGDVDARSLAALSGEAHVVKQLSTEGARAIDRSRDMRLESVATAGVTNAYVNLQRPPFDDLRVRQALAWGIDREELVATAADGQGEPAPSWLAPNPLYPEAKRTGYTRYDPERARRLLDEAGWRGAPGGRTRAKDGQPLTVRLAWWGSGRPLAELLQGQWTRLGASVPVDGSSDYGFLQQKRAQNDWDVFIEGWGTFGEPAALLARHVAADGDLNYMRFRDPQIDALLDGFGALADPEDRRQQALRVNERQAELVPFIPLFSRKSLTAVHRRVRNYVAHFLGTSYDLHPDLWVAG